MELAKNNIKKENQLLWSVGGLTEKRLAMTEEKKDCIITLKKVAAD